MDNQKDIVNKLKTLNSMIEDFLDRMDIEEGDDSEDEKDSKKDSKQEKED